MAGPRTRDRRRTARADARGIGSMAVIPFWSKCTEGGRARWAYQPPPLVMKSFRKSSFSEVWRDGLRCIDMPESAIKAQLAPPAIVLRSEKVLEARQMQDLLRRGTSQGMAGLSRYLFVVWLKNAAGGLVETKEGPRRGLIPRSSWETRRIGPMNLGTAGVLPLDRQRHERS